MAAEGEVVKRKLHELRVIDLKAELEKRELDKTGVKAVLLERMQQALQKDGHDPDEYMFEVTECTPIKKPSKRTNKKLARDDESETHSNVDESQNDLVLDDDEKMDSDDDRIDEKFFQVLETTDGGEDAIDLSIEEGDKLLIDEDYVGSLEKEEQVDVIDEKSKKTSGGEENLKPEGTASSASSSHENVSANSSKAKCTETESVSNSKGEDHGSLVVHVEEAQRDLDTEMASLAPAVSDQKEGLTNGDQEADSKKESGGTKKPSEEEQKKGDNKSTCSPEKASATSKGDEAGTNDKTKTPASEKGETKSPVKGGKQEEDKSAVTATNKAKSTTANTKDGKNAVEKPKAARPAISAKNLWVTGLSSTTRATDLKALFSKHGKVIGAKIVSNARSSVSRCYGFVTMATVEEASKCIQYLHRTELHGRMISVERAKTEPITPSRRKDAKAVVPAKKVIEKKEPVTPVKEANSVEKKTDEKNEKKEKDKEDEKVPDKVSSEKKEGVDAKAEGSEKDKDASAENAQDKSPKKDDDKGKREVHRSRSSTSRRSSSERISRESGHGSFRFRRVPTMSGFRRPFYRRPPMHHDHHNTLTFNRIRAERIRQRQREEEREMRESERRRRQDIIRQREIERKQREEAVRLERERERLRIERERLERERAEVLRLEREKQRQERERIEREREELRRRERMSRVDDHRRPVKRTFDTFRGTRDTDFDARKRPFVSNSSRRVDTFERKNDRFSDNVRMSRDTDLRGHSRDDRGMSFRDGNDSIGQSRPTPKDDWKAPQDRRGNHGVHRDRNDRFDSGKGMSGNVNYVVDRSGGSWHGGVSQSDSRGSGSKPYSSGGGMQSRDNWGSDRKSDGQSWGRSDGGDRWGSGMGGSSGSRNQQGLNMGQSLLPLPSSGMFDSSSGGGSGNMVGMGTGTGGSSYTSDRFDAYKSTNNMRRF